jgi:hypothetical protein
MTRPKWKQHGLKRRGPGRPAGTGNAPQGAKQAQKDYKKKFAQIRVYKEARDEIMSYVQAFSRFHPTGKVLSQPMIMEVLLQRYRKDIRKWLGMDDRLKPEDLDIGGKESSSGPP